MPSATLPEMQNEVVLVDCHYLEPEHVASFLIVHEGQGAFVDNGAPNAVPHLLDAAARQGLPPEDIAWIIVTHVHLDHAGGTSPLLDACPNATILAHGKAARHLIDPSRLIAGTKQVYGEALFEQMFGAIHPCDAGRVRVVEDGETVDWNGRGLRFHYTLGHCSHHAIIHDLHTNGVFTGDALGICHYGLQIGHRPYVFAAATPTEFDVAESRRALDTILNTGCEYLFVSHYGQYAGPEAYAASAHASLDRCEAVLEAAVASTFEGEALRQLVEEGVRTAIDEHLAACGVDATAEMRGWLETDIRLDTAGILHAALRRRRG